MLIALRDNEKSVMESSIFVVVDQDRQFHVVCDAINLQTAAHTHAI